jgi:arsenate reductase
MHVLGLMGSPRRKGNTAYLLSAMMTAARTRGAQVEIIEPAQLNLLACRGCGYCERKGRCIIDSDDMAGKVYALLRRADVVIMGTPIYFYNTPAQLKALIDRTQSLWSRIYKQRLHDPKNRFRQGFLLSVGATKGANLFEGVELTAKYFYDAIGASYKGSLTYRRIEEPGDMEANPGVLADVEGVAGTLFAPLQDRQRILFLCKDNTSHSQMAAAFANVKAGGSVEAVSAGMAPGGVVDAMMEDVMAEEGIDMRYQIPVSVDDVVADRKPDIVVRIGDGKDWPPVPGVDVIDWKPLNPVSDDITAVRQLRDWIKGNVTDLLKSHGVD